MFRRSDRARRYTRVLSSKSMVACDLYLHDDDACKTPSVSPFYERVNRSSDVTTSSTSLPYAFIFCSINCSSTFLPIERDLEFS